jgi:hypothetical protein
MGAVTKIKGPMRVFSIARSALCIITVYSATIGGVAAEVTQVTRPNFTPVDGVEFGLHRLPAVSPHADLVAFSSYSVALVENDTNNLPDIFLWSRSSGQVRTLTVGTNGGANGASYDPALSKDGRFVAFVSTASNFRPDTNKLDDVFVANVATGEIELVSVRLQTATTKLGSTRFVTISEDGRHVAYLTARNDVIPGGGSTRDHVIVRDRVAGQTIWVNPTLEGTSGTAKPIALRESRLWFFSNTNVYRFDLATRALKLFGPSSVDPAFNSAGSRMAQQLVTTRTNVVSWYDSATGETNVVFRAPTNRVVRYDSISMSDNGAIAFMAAHPDDTDRMSDVYVALPGGDPASPTWISSIPTSADATVAASGPMISPDGTRVYFRFTTISKFDSTRRVDLYVRELSAPEPELIASGAYFSKMVWTPAGPLVIGGSGDFGFQTPSNETDLALLPMAAPPPEVTLEIARVAAGWRISFEKIPNAIPKLQSTDVLDSTTVWNDTGLNLEDGGTEWIATDPTTTNQRFYRLQVIP